MGGWTGAPRTSEQYHVFAHPPSYPVLDWMDSVTNPTADFGNLFEKSRDSDTVMHESHASQQKNLPATPPPPGASKPPVLTLSAALQHRTGLRAAEEPFFVRLASLVMQSVGTGGRWLLGSAVRMKSLVPEEMLPLAFLGATMMFVIILQKLLSPVEGDAQHPHRHNNTRARSHQHETGPNGQNAGNSASAAETRRGPPSLNSDEIGAVARHFITGSHRKDVRAALASLLKECPHVALVGERGNGGAMGGEGGGGEDGGLDDFGRERRGATGVSSSLGGNGDSVRRVVLVVNPAEDPGSVAGQGGLAGWLSDGLRRRVVGGGGVASGVQGADNRGRQGSSGVQKGVVLLRVVLLLLLCVSCV